MVLVSLSPEARRGPIQRRNDAPARSFIWHGADSCQTATGWRGAVAEGLTTHKKNGIAFGWNECDTVKLTRD